MKRSTAGAVAFEHPDWEPHDALPTFELGGVIAGATICHDSYLGLLGMNGLSPRSAITMSRNFATERRSLAPEMARLIDGLGLETVDVTLGVARRVADTYARWGKGWHPAGLNFGDCFAYEVAKTRGCPLLFVGADFSGTDVESVL